MIMEIKNGPTRQFLEKIAKSWSLSFVWTKIWAIAFSPSDGTNNKTLAENIYFILDHFDDINKFKPILNSDDNIYGNLLNMPSGTSIDMTATKHFILANKVSIPQELVKVNNQNSIGANMSGGIIRGLYVTSRFDSDDRTLDITFLDTNAEFIDMIIKPWIVAISHRGLIETTELPSLRCDITAFFFAKSSPNATMNGVKISDGLKNLHGESLLNSNYAIKDTKISSINESVPFLRKKIVFKNCFPISIPTKNYHYAIDLSAEEQMTEVKFQYDYYIIENIELPDSQGISGNTVTNGNITSGSTSNSNTGNGFTVDNVYEGLGHIDGSHNK